MTVSKAQAEKELFQNIICKFLLNLPRDEKENMSRLSFHVEKAFYYYIDIVVQSKPQRDAWDRLRMQFFFKLQQYSIPSLKINPQLIIHKLNESKPVWGAIIFNTAETKVVVIKKGSKLGFPKGKRDQNQSETACAVRQVFEETGLMINLKINPYQRIEFQKHGVSSVFFLVRGVSENDRFKADKTEIDSVFWMRTSDISARLNQFVGRSRQAWLRYEQELERSKSLENFINYYRPTELPPVDQDVNPLLNFKFDLDRLRKVLSSGWGID